MPVKEALLLTLRESRKLQYKVKSQILNYKFQINSKKQNFNFLILGYLVIICYSGFVIWDLGTNLSIVSLSSG